MHQMLIIMTALCVTLVNGDTEDRPSVISKIEADTRDGLKELTHPRDFTVVAKNSDLIDVTNKLICRASNVETMKWQYSKNSPVEESSWNDTLPTIVKAKFSVDGAETIAEITDSSRQLKDRITINGYYRCVASNRGYQTTSPVVRIISPYLQGGPLPGADSPPGVAREHEPFIIACVKTPVKVDGKIEGYEVVPEDARKHASTVFKYKWIDEGKADIDFDGGRIKVDPLSGDLYYAYLKRDDKLAGSKRISCIIAVGELKNTYETNDVTSLIIEPSSESQPVDVTVEYPTAAMLGLADADGIQTTKPEHILKCISGQTCRVGCIFGGIKGVTGVIQGSSPDNPRVYTGDGTGFEFTPPEEEAEQTWSCKLLNPANPTDVYKTVKIEIKIMNYPKLTRTENFPILRYAPSGKPITFECDAHYATDNTFYINGVEVPDALPSQYTIADPKPDNSGAVLCISSNDVGKLYTTSTLIVYDEAVITQAPLGTKEDPGYIVLPNTNNTDGTYTFNCSATLDNKTDTASIVWRSTRKGLETKEITKADNEGVQRVKLEPLDYKPYSSNLGSVLTLVHDSGTEPFIRNTTWWCELKYSILGYEDGSMKIIGKKILFDIKAPPGKVIGNEPWPHLPLVLGAVGGFVFLILLIVLINCYVQKNKGEQYYVDEKERKAGHNPEEEMEAYGFSDYTRPDQNPVKGSRASMNFSDKPMESDTGSLDEYGDVDPNRFNEDGSFIGQYGQNQSQYPPRNQADV